jgi:hypothetical protein
MHHQFLERLTWKNAACIFSARLHCFYRVFKEQAGWTFILPSELPAKELRHLPRKMSPRGTTY